MAKGALEDQFLPSPNHRLPGRPKKVRIRGNDEEKKVGKRSCKACNGVGHDNMTCDRRQNEEARKGKKQKRDGASTSCTEVAKVAKLGSAEATNVAPATHVVKKTRGKPKKVNVSPANIAPPTPSAGNPSHQVHDPLTQTH